MMRGRHRKTGDVMEECPFEMEGEGEEIEWKKAGPGFVFCFFEDGDWLDWLPLAKSDFEKNDSK